MKYLPFFERVYTDLLRLESFTDRKTTKAMRRCTQFGLELLDTPRHNDRRAA